MVAALVSPKRVLRWWQNLTNRKALVGYSILALGFLASMYVTDTSRRALCAQREDLQEQIRVTDTFLHPRTPKERRQARMLFAVIPRQIVDDGQRRTKRTRDNLKVLYC